jgi:hypothetical protein
MAIDAFLSRCETGVFLETSLLAFKPAFSKTRLVGSCNRLTHLDRDVDWPRKAAWRASCWNCEAKPDFAEAGKVHVIQGMETEAHLF